VKCQTFKRKWLPSEKQVDALTRASQPPTTLPSSLGHLGCRYALVTNWVAFAAGLDIEGCEQELHLPLFDLELPARVHSSCVIFR
jgi:hypothetical protein